MLMWELRVPFNRIYLNDIIQIKTKSNILSKDISTRKISRFSKSIGYHTTLSVPNKKKEMDSGRCEGVMAKVAVGKENK